MPVFAPFRGLRFRDDILSESVAPPYDVLSRDDVIALRKSSISNVTWIDVPQPGDGDDPYAVAANKMSEWRESEILVSDDSPTFTIYRMTFTDESGKERTISGVIGALEVVSENIGGVLPHERTTPKASTDRLDLTVATQANLSPVWGLSRAVGLSEALNEPGELLGRITLDGVTHRVERVKSEERISAIRRLVEASDVLIADGHHRYGVARQFRAYAEEQNLPISEHAKTTMVFVNEMSQEQLAIAAIHRLYNDVTFSDLRESLLRTYDSIGRAPADERALQMISDESAIALVSGDDTVELFRPRPEADLGDRDLDGARLEKAFSGTVHTVTYQHGVHNVVHAVRSGEASAGILIRPVPFEEIVRTAEKGDLMPPKSTFFTPKLLTGLVIRPMD